jgi:outer membrane receptor protein involved in Fe transport
MKKITTLLFMLLAAGRAYAQDIPPEVQIAPTTEEPEVPSGGSTIDLQNIVTTAAKGVTTVQEAPAIVTIITADDLKTWGYRTLEEVLTDVPGWNYYPALGETIWTLTVRGQTQSMLLLHDGISLFHASHNVYGDSQQLPLESIKRVEVVTGPGGVLWGANSFQGIVNVITKDADDVNGVEASAGYGDGRGFASDMRAYAMMGQSLLDGRLKMFVHGSYENYQGQIIEGREVIAHSPAPQPNGPAFYGGLETSDQPRSFLYSVDGKISMGPLSLYWLWEGGEMHHGGTFPLGIVLQSGNPMIPWEPSKATDPLNTGRDNRFEELDRFASLEYRDRFANGRVGLTTKGYVVQSDLDLTGFMFIPPSALLQGGAAFNMNLPVYRSGVTLDGDIALPYSNRLLFGGEGFREWEDGSTSYFYSENPTDALHTDSLGKQHSTLPFLCPHATGTTYVPQCPVPFLFPANREVAAAFISDQFRPVPSVTLDGGARIQAGFGQRSYDPLALFSGTIVWNFIPGWHLKANFSQGFRPPVFSNTNTNGSGVQLGGNPNLQNERSNAAQGEINARILRNVRKVRELTMRADYSFSRIDNLIAVQNGVYVNSGARAINSAEFLARLYLRGDHTIQLGYTYLQVQDDQLGFTRFTPNHWFTLNANFNVVRDKLDVVSTLRFSGAAEDPNRLPVGLTNCVGAMNTTNCESTAAASNITLDRLPAIANWNLGMRWRNVVENVDLSAFVYNVLDQHWFFPDAFYALSPQLELQPYPGPGRNFFAKVAYRFQ